MKAITGYSSTDVISEEPRQFLIQKIQNWVETTTEGRRYRIKSPAIGFPPDLILQRGQGILTAPIFIEFTFSELAGTTQIHVRSYLRTSFFPFSRMNLQLPIKRGLLARIPRRNASRDLQKLLAFLGVADYRLNHCSPRTRTIWFKTLASLVLAYCLVITVIFLPVTLGWILVLAGFPEAGVAFWAVAVLVGLFIIWWIISATRKTFSNQV